MAFSSRFTGDILSLMIPKSIARADRVGIIKLSVVAHLVVLIGDWNPKTVIRAIEYIIVEYVAVLTTWEARRSGGMLFIS